MGMIVRIQVLREGAQVPQYQTLGAAASDLCACIDDPVVLQPGDFQLVPTGIALEIPEGYEAQIRPRSGLALRHGITFPNSPGTIDSDYRGEIGIIMMNLGREPFTVNHGDRIAQMVIARHETVQFKEVDELSDTERKGGGFGSTGKK